MRLEVLPGLLLGHVELAGPLRLDKLAVGEPSAKVRFDVVEVSSLGFDHGLVSLDRHLRLLRRQDRSDLGQDFILRHLNAGFLNLLRQQLLGDQCVEGFRSDLLLELGHQRCGKGLQLTADLPA